jgi:hypothetical protein
LMFVQLNFGYSAKHTQGGCEVLELDSRTIRHLRSVV